MKHSANLDILRSFAVTLVLIDHLVPTLVARTGFHNAAVSAFTNQIGHAGVLAFFVHTSLVLMYSLERMSQTPGAVTLRFYVRRFFRIYPLSIFCIVMALVLHIPNNVWRTVDPITPPIIVANLLLVQNLFTKISVLVPLWSLPYEVQMYLVLPLLYFLALRKRSPAYLFGLYALFCGIGFLIALRSTHMNMAAYAPCFICGVLCYSLRNRIRQVVPSFLWPVFVVALISAYCLTNLHGEPNFWIGWLYCLILGLAINAFHDSGNKPLKFAAQKVALYSYGMYLLHVPVLYLLFVVFGMQNRPVAVVLFFALTTIGSVITYHFIEAPLIEVGRRVSSHPVQTPALASTK